MKKLKAAAYTRYVAIQPFACASRFENHIPCPNVLVYHDLTVFFFFFFGQGWGNNTSSANIVQYLQYTESMGRLAI